MMMRPNSGFRPLAVAQLRFDSSHVGQPLRPINRMVARSSGRSNKMPRRIVLARVWRVRNPLQAPDADDRAQPRHEGNRLSGVQPVGIDQEPCRRLVGEVDDDRVQTSAVATADW